MDKMEELPVDGKVLLGTQRLLSQRQRGRVQELRLLEPVGHDDPF